MQCYISTDTDWTYSWFTGNNLKSSTPGQTITTLSNQAGQYRCVGVRTGRPQWSQLSVFLPISVTDYQPSTTLTSDKEDVFTGDSVTLSCTVESSGWKFYWYRHRPDSTPVTTTSVYSYTLSWVSVSDGGQYWCRAGRGDPVYYTLYSDPVQINITARIGGSGSGMPGPTLILCLLNRRDRAETSPDREYWLRRNRTVDMIAGGSELGTTAEDSVLQTIAGDPDLRTVAGGSGLRRSRSSDGNRRWIVSPGSSTSVLVGVVVGLVVSGFLLVILLVLLWRFKNAKGSCFNRIFLNPQPQRTNQDPQQDQGSTQSQAPDAGYTRLQHGGDHIYDTINPSENNDNGTV
ncbi:leukocyte immunoglobulin-like receptor subfamily B member 2 [Salvelinus sp. IW2-2015]|uniref:leukocyte immunoglobulin-like receptor subfamily B member 2 n=1 Tax=Salvelinus sp. IW2-2015 TaxID=2691554 RepID=UPI000CEB01C3|nr:uncharacterized protein LOC112070414 [Salvelinus alpinus]